MSFEFASQNVLKIIEDHKMTFHEVPSPNRQRSEKIKKNKTRKLKKAESQKGK